MKKYLLILFHFAFCIEHSAFSQAGEWTWISGANTVNALPVFGTQGVPSVFNNPGAIYEPLEWKDKQGNFWVYGGWNYYSDLWKFNPSTLEWTWVKGSGMINQMTVYGTQGVPNIANTPGFRDWVATSWVDTSGNFWLFGGSIQNDLWRFDISTYEWTWMNGDIVPNMPGNHGIQGVPSILNHPGCRKETCSGWTDAYNNLWLFGGEGYNDLSQSGALNDLMKYDISTNEWTWMSGTDNVNMTGNYGTKGVSSSTNMPGGRWTNTKWKDLQDNFWLFGGSTANMTNYFNDVWKYDPGINEWTWMAGNNFLDHQGIYNGPCIYDSLNIPWSRVEHRAGVTDNCGKFWLFGGCTSWSLSTSLNDLWVFDPQQKSWNWMSGTNFPNAPANHGTLGVSSPANIPSSRYGSVAWWGNDNRFYLFGGYSSFQSWGDLWVFTPDSICTQVCLPVPTALFIAPNDICPGSCTDFINHSLQATNYLWSFPGANPSFSTDASPTNICYSSPGNYDVTLIATNSNGSDTLTLQNYITVYPYPSPQGILQSGDTLFANQGATSYQWFFNNIIINGATDYYYIASASGNYNVVATDENDCEVEAVINDVIAAISLQPALLTEGSAGLAIYPNPVIDKFTIQKLAQSVSEGSQVTPDSYRDGTAVELSIYNLYGEKMQVAVDCCPLTVDCRQLPSGLYYIEINSNDKTLRSKFLKQ